MLKHGVDLIYARLEINGKGDTVPTSEFPLQRLKSLRDVADSHVFFVVI